MLSASDTPSFHSDFLGMNQIRLYIEGWFLDFGQQSLWEILGFGLKKGYTWINRYPRPYATVTNLGVALL